MIITVLENNTITLHHKHHHDPCFDYNLCGDDYNVENELSETPRISFVNNNYIPW